MRSEVSKTCEFTICGGFIRRKIREAIMTVTQYSMAKYTANAGNEDCGNDFPDMLQADRALNLQKFQNYTDKTAKLFIKLLQNTGEI